MPTRYNQTKRKLSMMGLAWLFIMNFCATDIYAQVHCKVFIYVQPDFCNTGNVILHSVPWNTLQPPITFLWSTGETTQDISVPANSGTYSVTVSDGAGCVVTESVDLNAFNLTYFIQQFNGCPYEPIYLAIEWNNLTQPGNYEYEWSNGDMTSVATVTMAGTYTVTITDPISGCSVVLSIDAVVHPEPIPTITGTPTLCSGNSGSLTVLGGPYTSIFWFPGGWDTETVTITEPDTYMVTVFNAFGCIGTATFEVISSGDLPIVVGPASLCSGQMATLTITNPGLFTSINWSDGSTTPSMEIFGPGQYSVTVTDMSGCDAVEYIDVLDTSFGITGTETPNTSCGSPNGIIDITVTPAGSYTYTWSNGATTEDLINIPGGSYEVTVTDQNMCTNTLVFGILDTGPSMLLDHTFTNATCGQNNGSIDLTVSPSGSYTFSWSNGASTEDINNLSAGTYNVTVTGSSGCTNTTSVTIGNTNSSFNTTGITTDNTSCLTPNGSINLTINPSGSYTFSWSNGTSSEDINNLTSGSYSVTVTDATSCSSVATFSVVDNVISPMLTTTAINTNCGQANGSINLTVTPAGSYVFTWSNGAVTEDISNLSIGNYNVTVTSSNGCTATTSVTIINTNSSFNVTGITTDNTSCLTPNGSINITIMPSGSYTFSWSNGASTEDINNLTSASYSVTVTDATSCSSVTSFTVSDNVISPMLTTTTTNATCGQANGSINLIVTPSGSYVFSWSNGASTEDISNLSSGTYNVTVTGSNGCTATTSATILNDNSSFNITGITTDNTSCLMPNGSINLTVTPSGSYAFLWSNGASSEDINNLTSGSYSVTVTDATSCSSVASFTVGDNVISPMLTTTTINTNCGQANGSINLTVTPIGPYVFTWSNGAISEDISNLSVGTYNVTVTSSNGCTATTSATILNDNTSFNVTGITTDNSSCLTPNGSINLTITPIGSYTFSWSNGASSEDVNNLTSGTYSVTVTDATSCSSVASFTVSNNVISPMLTTTTINTNCGQANGSINLTVTPIGPYVFTWSNGAVSEDISNLSIGNYNVTVTGSNGCTATTSATILNENSSFNITGITADNTSCLTPNGSINITINPSGSYTFSWSNGASTEDINNLTSGSYSVTVTDATSCSSVASFTIADNVITPILTTSMINANCGQANGSINLSVTPAGSYVFSWSNGSSTEDISNLSSGTYNVTVTSSNGCTATTSATILNENTSFNVTGITTDNTSCLTSNGSINLTVTPSGSYTFLWSNGTSSEDINNLTSGTYSVTVTDATSCSSVASFTVSDNVISPMLTTTTTNATCGQTNGSINLIVMPSGSYVFSWSNGASTEDISNLSVGTYNVIVTGSNGCTATTSATIINTNSSFNVTGITTDNTSCLIPNGSINLTVAPSGSYTFSWSNGASSEDINNLTSGTYRVTVTDAALCSNVVTFSVADNVIAPLLTTTTINTNCGQSNGSINLTVTPAGSYVFTWSNGAVSEDISNLSIGNYNVTVTGSNGCTSTTSATIVNDNSSFNITGITTDNTSCLMPNGSINLTVTPIGSYTFSWSNGASNEDINNLTSGSYSVTVTDAALCSNVVTFSVADNVIAPLLITTTINTNCGQSNGSINLTVTPAGSYVFTWSNGAVTEDISNLSAGTYIVTVTGASGCTATTTATIINTNSSFNVTGITTDNTSCLMPNGSINLTITPSGSYTFLWSNGASSEDINNLNSGSYSVTVTDATSCSSVATFTILENTSLPLIELLAHAPDCFGNAGWIEVIIPTSPNDLTYSMDRGLTFSALSKIENLSPGEYEVMVKNGLGCAIIHTIQIPEQQELTIQVIPEIYLKIGVSQQIEVDIADLPIALIDTIIWTPANALIFADTSIYSLLHPTFLDAPEGSYTITIYTHDGCSADATVNVRNVKDLDIYAPNIIHSESSSINNSFYLVSKPGSVKIINKLSIYDRWGNLVFLAKNIQPDDPTVGWSGTFRGQAVNPAVFVWVADITFIDDSTLIKKGDLTVIR